MIFVQRNTRGVYGRAPGRGKPECAFLRVSTLYFGWQVTGRTTGGSRLGFWVQRHSRIFVNGLKASFEDQKVAEKARKCQEIVPLANLGQRIGRGMAVRGLGDGNAVIEQTA